MNIYLYHLTQNGVIRYVGVTQNPHERKNWHKRTKPPHTFEIIDTFTDKEEAGIAEQYHIAGHNTFKDGWNKSIGGETLLTGENHPSWKGGIWSLNKETYMKEYYERNRDELLSKQKEYEQTPERKEYHKEYWQRPEVKEKDRKRRKTPARKEYDRKRQQTPERKEYMKAYHARKKQELLDSLHK